MAENQLYITRLVQKELSQKDGDALVAEAKRAVAAEEANLEPDLALLTTADFEALAPTSTQRGQETVRATQAMLLADTGNPCLTDEQMQQLILDGVADMQMAEHLAIQSHRVRLRGYHKITAATAGGPQSGFSDFMGQMFCGSLASGSSRGSTQGGGDVEKEPCSRPPSPAARSTASIDVDDYCPLEECKIVYPTSSDGLTMSGVPAEFLSPRSSDGHYGCLYGDCGAKISGKPAAASHIRRKHLGIAIGCYVCNRRYYKPQGWMDHMKSKHSNLSRGQWWVNPEEGDASCSVNEPDPHAAAKAIAKVVASSIHPSASKPPIPESSTPKPATSEPPPVKGEEKEGGDTTDSDVMIVETGTNVPPPKKRKQ